MLQRIQTVYLLIIVALMTATLFLPLANVQIDNAFYRFDATGISAPEELIYPTWGLFALVAAITFIALATIFFYKKRILQIRLCVFNAILMICFYALWGYYVWNAQRISGEGFAFNCKIVLTFPVISLILDYLAIRNIGADEALVRSLERLR
ncbi:MAG TPA: DUF4293 domain-containing protein [Parabacteroides sp.]|nr:DUF4293 domain-containing protein [Parabacteroides sp.]